MANTIQREPERVRAVVEEIVGLIAAEDRGDAETHVEGGSFEAEVFWLARNMDKVERANLLRAAALLIAVRGIPLKLHQIVGIRLTMTRDIADLGGECNLGGICSLRG